MSMNTLSEFHSFIDQQAQAKNGVRWLVFALIAWVSLLILITLFLWVQYVMVSNKEAKIEKTNAILMAQYHAKYPDRLGFLDNQESIYRAGGAVYFNYLSSFPYAGIWLSDINIALDKNEINLSGHTLSPQDFSSFINVLQQNTSPFDTWVVISTDMQERNFTILLRKRS